MFFDRYDAGRQLGVKLREYATAEALVYALPREGVPFALEVARTLRAPFELIHNA